MHGQRKHPLGELQVHRLRQGRAADDRLEWSGTVPDHEVTAAEYDAGVVLLYALPSGPDETDLVALRVGPADLLR